MHRGYFAAILGCIVLALFMAPFLSVAAQAENPEDIEFTVEEDGSIVAAVADTTFGVTGDCVIGLILVGPRNDNGWSQAHFEAAEAVSNEQDCELVLFESLNPADAPGTTMLDVATQMVDQGADIIIATSDAFEEDSNTVAAAFPSVVLLNMTGSNRLEHDAPDNLANSNSMFEASRFVAGCAATLKAYNSLAPLEAGEKISIGFVGPLINFETRRHQNSAYIGARHCANELGLDPDEQLEFEVTWIGFWFNIPGVTLDPTEVTTNFFDRGFDVVISGIDTTEPLQVAGQRRAQGEDVWAVGTDNINACNVASEACVGEQFYDWYQTYTDHVSALKEGTWTARWELRAPNWEEFTNTEAGQTTVGFDMNTVTDEERAILDDVIAELAADMRANPGMVPGWRGPLSLQDGTLLAEEGEVMNPFRVWFLPQLLEGMIGPSTSE